MLHIRDGVWRLAGTVDNLMDYLPAGTRTGKVHWEATFRVGEKVAEKFNLNNVFLLGDAAHIHSPARGSGMNTCIEDSYIFAGLAADGKQKQYYDLRHRDIRQMVGVLGQLTDKIAGQNFMGRSIRKNFHLFSFLFPLFMPTMRKFLLGIK
jgi:2-polyprenyl-6-methoxyphenol hydroxylase-like FAD-dependent oxidoreductase